MRDQLAAAALAAALTATLAPAASSPHAPPAGLLIADGGLGGVLEIVGHDVRVVVNNGIAVTTVDQVFRNTEERVVEALYTFPVPKGGSVASFSMWIAGKEMIGEVVRKERAREIYDSYKQRGADPGLLEQVDYKAFEMRVFPIAALAEQRVSITYYQELDVDHDWCTYVYPLATTTRRAVDTRVRGRFSLSLEVKSAVPIAAMRSPSHEAAFALVAHDPSYHQASLEATSGELTRDVVVAWQLAKPVTGVDLVASRQEGEPGYALLTVTAGDDLAARDAGMDYVFVSDVSGSMADDGKLDVSRHAVSAFLGELAPADRFELIAFHVQPTALFGRLTAQDRATLAKADAFLDDQRAKGGTSLRPAVEAAYRYRDPDRQLNVVILSDGLTEEREHQQLLQLIADRPPGVRVFCIGVGNDVNRPLLAQVAREAGGLAAFVSRGDDLERQAQAFRRKLLRPAIGNVELAMVGGGIRDVEPRQLPDLFHGSPIRVYARYDQPGPVVVTLRGTVEGREWQRRCELVLPAEEPANPEIDRMWASRRVERLEEDERRTGNEGAHAEEIVDLCETHSIASQRASFLVLENDSEYRRWKIERRNAARTARDRAAQARLQAALQAMRDRAARRLEPIAPQELVAPIEPGAAAEPARPRPDRGGPRAPSVVDEPATGRQGGGGGAFDPLTAALALGLAVACGAARRRRSRPGSAA